MPQVTISASDRAISASDRAACKSIITLKSVTCLQDLDVRQSQCAMTMGRPLESTTHAHARHTPKVQASGSADAQTQQLAKVLLAHF